MKKKYKTRFTNGTFKIITVLITSIILFPVSSNSHEIKEGKIERLSLWLKQKKLDLKDFESVYFYSDSQNDLPLLRTVSNPIAANPDEVLEREAKKNDWPIIILK